MILYMWACVGVFAAAVLAHRAMYPRGFWNRVSSGFRWGMGAGVGLGAAASVLV